MELRHLRYFLAVVEERQFVRAAATLHVAQSALSAQIRDLERDLGAELLVRDRRGVTPTPAGEVLLTHARAILDEAETARVEIAELTGLVTGTLSVGTGSPSGPVPLSATLAEFQRRHPNVDIAVRDTTSEELLTWLDNGTVDLAFISFPLRQLPPRLSGRPVALETVVVLVPADHPFAGEEALSLEAISGQPLVTFTRGSGMRATIETGFAAAGVPLPPITAETIDPLMILELVSHKLGVSLAPESFAALADRTVTAVPLAAPGLTRPLTLAWSRERRSLPALGAFLELAAQSFPTLPDDGADPDGAGS
jgi:DNA-binding transcriptional LysR family regulator